MILRAFKVQLDVNNKQQIQWVTKDINLIKNKLSHQSFIDLCKYIYEKFKTAL